MMYDISNEDLFVTICDRTYELLTKLIEVEDGCLWEARDEENRLVEVFIPF